MSPDTFGKLLRNPVSMCFSLALQTNPLLREGSEENRLGPVISVAVGRTRMRAMEAMLELVLPWWRLGDSQCWQMWWWQLLQRVVIGGGLHE